MNITRELLSLVIILVLGVYFLSRLSHDCKLVNILKRYPLPQAVRGESLIDLSKLFVFVQGVDYTVKMTGSVQAEASRHAVKVLGGTGEIVITLTARGYTGVYTVRRVVRVLASPSTA
ncbi:MAG: hypothetical protein LM577_03625 [Thermoproteaceae archaeon]|jgi:hypothetical protein|nr:hypothetical protein [Thermoproteaceae archaeon]